MGVNRLVQTRQTTPKKKDATRFLSCMVSDFQQGLSFFTHLLVSLTNRQFLLFGHRAVGRNVAKSVIVRFLVGAFVSFRQGRGVIRRLYHGHLIIASFKEICKYQRVEPLRGSTQIIINVDVRVSFYCKFGSCGKS